VDEVINRRNVSLHLQFREHAKTAAALLFALCASALALNAPENLGIRLTVIAPQPGTYKAYYATISHPSFNEEATETLELRDTTQPIGLTFTPPRESLAALRIDLGFAPGIIEIHAVDLLWNGVPLRRWPGPEIPQILLPTSQISSLSVVGDITRVEAVGGDPFVTATATFIEALVTWPQRVKWFLIALSVTSGLLVWMALWVCAWIGQRRMVQVLLEVAWPSGAAGSVKGIASFDERRMQLLILVLFLSFYTATFCLGGFEQGFYTIDGKVQYDQMRAIVGGDVSLLVAPTKHLGFSLVELPLYLVGLVAGALFGTEFNPLAARLSNVFTSAALCWVVFRLARLYASPRGATALTLLVGFGTTVWPQSKSDTADPLLALFVVSSFWCLAEYSRSGERKWFRWFLVAIAGALVTKLVAHAFLAGWLLHLLFVKYRRHQSWRSFSVKATAVLALWVAALPLSFSVMSNSPAYALDTWNFFEGIGQKIALRTVSPLDGLLPYCPLLLIAALGWRRFLLKAPGDTAVILVLILPYLAPLVLGQHVVSLFDFGSRYDLTYQPLLLLGIIPFLAGLSRASRRRQIVTFVVIVAAVYVQTLGSIVSPLYYAGILEGGLGDEVIARAFDWRVTPFGIYPLLIVRSLTGVEVPLDRFGLNNLVGSIQEPFMLDYFWTTTSSYALQTVAIGLFLAAGIALFLLLREAALLDLLRRRAIGALAIVAVIGIVWVWYFVPTEAFRSGPMETILENTLAPSEGSAIGAAPTGWTLNDISVDGGGPPSVLLASAPVTELTPHGGLQVSMLRDYVMMSVSSAAFDVLGGELIEGSLLAESGRFTPVRVRFGFILDRDPYYFSATTQVSQAADGQRRLTTRVVVPDGARKAIFQAVVWGGGLTVGETVTFTDARVSRIPGR
jgi:hypothetical protein